MPRMYSSSVCWPSGSPTAMLVPDFGPTMNVIAYSPFQDGLSAKAVGASDRAIVSGAAHKPTRLRRRSGAIGFSSRPATAVELGCADTSVDVRPTYSLPTLAQHR